MHLLPPFEIILRNILDGKYDCYRSFANDVFSQYASAKAKAKTLKQLWDNNEGMSPKKRMEETLGEFVKVM